MRLIRRLPKRGFKNPGREAFLPVNVGQLAVFEAGSEVSAADMRRVGVANGAGMPVKILGTGEVGRALTVRAHAFSALAKQKIEAAGGQCIVED